jgi:hypothetical protein
MNGSDIVETLKGCLGNDGFNTVVAAFGGQELIIPVKPTGKAFARIIDGVGYELAAVMVEVFSGDQIYVPNGKRDRSKQLRHDVITARANGISVDTIAKKNNVSSRWVRAILAMERNKTK